MRRLESMARQATKVAVRSGPARIIVPSSLGVAALWSACAGRRNARLAVVGGAMVGSALWSAAVQREMASATSRSFKNYAASLRDIEGRLYAQSAKPEFGSWAIFPDCGVVLLDLLEEQRPKVILELGGGTSTWMLAAAIEEWNLDCEILSVEHDADFLRKTDRVLRDQGLDRHVTLVHAELKPQEVDGSTFSWYDIGPIRQELAPRPPVDMLVVDGPPGRTGRWARFPAVPLLADKLASDPLVLLDDASRRDERRILRRWAEVYPSLEFRVLPTERGTGIGFCKGNAPAAMRKGR